jgi:polyphosphate kinase 2 (PPK2 family)
MDAAGKDGVNNHVLSFLNPQGCRAQSFKVPSSLELAHDFLWRIHAAAPKKGEIVIFNRSTTRTSWSSGARLVPEKVWRGRYDDQRFRKTADGNGVVIVKFFLHISPEDQLRRFKAASTTPTGSGKSAPPTTRSKFWPAYRTAFEEARTLLHRTGAVVRHSFGQEIFRNYAISKILVETMKDMKIEMPPVSVDIDAGHREYELAKMWKKRAGIRPAPRRSNRGGDE